MTTGSSRRAPRRRACSSLPATAISTATLHATRAPSRRNGLQRLEWRHAEQRRDDLAARHDRHVIELRTDVEQLGAALAPREPARRRRHPLARDRELVAP